MPEEEVESTEQALRSIGGIPEAAVVLLAVSRGRVPSLTRGTRGVGDGQTPAILESEVLREAATFALVQAVEAIGVTGWIDAGVVVVDEAIQTSQTLGVVGSAGEAVDGFADIAIEEVPVEASHAADAIGESAPGLEGAAARGGEHEGRHATGTAVSSCTELLAVVGVGGTSAPCIQVETRQTLLADEGLHLVSLTVLHLTLEVDPESEAILAFRAHT